MSTSEEYKNFKISNWMDSQRGFFGDYSELNGELFTFSTGKKYTYDNAAKDSAATATETKGKPSYDFDLATDSITTKTQGKPTKDKDPVSPYDYTSGTDGGFNINLDFTGDGWSPELIQEAQSMADLLSTLIISDLPDEKYKGNIIDDLSLELEIGSLDGTGGVLGNAGVMKWRQGSDIPLIGKVYLDEADSERLFDQGRFDDLVLHEMIHTIGFVSTNESLQSLVDENNIYIGQNGQHAYQMGVDNGVYQAEYDLLTNWDSGFHWDHEAQSLPANEIMSPYIYGTNQLSTVTLAVIEDLGYQTMWGDGQLTNTPFLLDEITSNWAATNGWS
jgi:hypothetical protein